MQKNYNLRQERKKKLLKIFNKQTNKLSVKNYKIKIKNK